eukprot:TRINITY_DN5144_c0_g1_i1.p1 TRINITY_DN5144_c0_g1~~TRINITY_DN5144_c0_g1_i1.p1  ORF type:complete len:879 (+),score=148.47 TRINITY_DN5144_c0_g1_i1:108-2744(+)
MSWLNRPWQTTAALLLVLVAATLSTTSSQYVNVVSFGVIAEQQLQIDPTYSGALQSESENHFRSFKLWTKRVNDAGGLLIGNTSYLVNLTLVNVGVAATQIAATVEPWARGDFGPVDIFFAPFGTASTNVTAQVMHRYERLMIAPSSGATENFRCQATTSAHYPCTIVGARRFPYMWGIPSPSDVNWFGSMTLLRLKGAKTIAILLESNSHSATVYRGALTAAKANKIQVVKVYNIANFNSNSSYVDVVQDLKEIQPDIVLNANSALGGCVNALNTMNSFNYFPKAYLGGFCISNPQSKPILTDKARFVIEWVQWVPGVAGPLYEDSLHFPPTENATSSSKFVQAFNELHGVDPTFAASNAFAAAEVFQAALLKGKSLDPTILKSSIDQISVTTFQGPVTFDQFGQPIVTEVPIIQNDLALQSQVLIPVAAATGDFVYPAPAWDQRDYVPKYVSTPAESVLLAFAALLILIGLILLVVVVVLRNNDVFRASTPAFLVILLLGCLMCLVAIFNWTLTPTSGMCIARVWLLALGSSCILGTTFSKTWRIARILSNEKMQPLVIPTSFLLRIFGLIVGIDIVILIVWTAVSPMSAVVSVVDANRPIFNFMTCSPPNLTAHFALLGIEIAYKGLLILVSIVVAWKTRSVKLLLFNESRYIGFTIYNMFLCLAIIVPIQFANVERTLEFVLRSIFIMVIIGATMFFLLGTKLWLFKKDPSLWERKSGGTPTTTELATSNSGGKSRWASISTTSENSTADVKKLKDKIEELEARLASYESLRKRAKKMKRQLSQGPRGPMAVSKKTKKETGAAKKSQLKTDDSVVVHPNPESSNAKPKRRKQPKVEVVHEDNNDGEESDTGEEVFQKRSKPKKKKPTKGDHEEL